MKYITITELTKTFDVTARMVRYYEKMGLITSSRKDDYAYRIYDENAVRRLQQIIVLRKLRIPLKQIAVILDDYEQSRALQVMRENVAELDEEIDALNTIRDILKVFVARLDEGVRRNIHLNLLEDSELLAMAKTLSYSKTSLKEGYSMNELNKVNEMIHKLSDREVRILYLPPMTVASVHCSSETPENDCHSYLKKFIIEKNLREIKPDFRVMGFNNDMTDCHGYEMWVTVPENLEISEPFTKKQFSGGLYGAHMIPMGAFEEWKWLYEWAEASKEYDIDWRAPESEMGGMMEEHLNYINIFNGSLEQLEKIMQLDLLIPIKRREE